MKISFVNQKVSLENREEFTFLMKDLRGDRKTLTDEDEAYSSDYQGFGYKSKLLLPYVDLESYLDVSVWGSSAYNHRTSNTQDMSHWFRLLDLTDLEPNIPLELWPLEDLWEMIPFVLWLFRVENHRAGTEGNEEWYSKTIKQMGENPYCAEMIRRGIDKGALYLCGEGPRGITERHNSYDFFDALTKDLPEALDTQFALRYKELMVVWDRHTERAIDGVEDEAEFERMTGSHLYDTIRFPSDIDSYFPASVDMFRRQVVITQKDF